jgi:hypothetical protein
MPKPKSTRTEGESPLLPRIQRLLSEQTSVILQDVDEKLSAQHQKIEGRFAAQNLALAKRFSAIEKRIDKLEERFMTGSTNSPP